MADEPFVLELCGFVHSRLVVGVLLFVHKKLGGWGREGLGKKSRLDLRAEETYHLFSTT